jgi:ABC-2 type transport system permease protein
MTATVVEAPLARRRAHEPPNLRRLTGVELRKMADTLSGIWLLISVGALTITFALIAAFTGTAEDHTLRSILSDAVFPAEVLLPVVGILLVSSEWSQRTSMTTFTLVPQRLRVLAAKLTAAIGPSLVALALALGAGGLATALADGGSWSLPAAIVGQEAVLLVSVMLMGVAFGAALLSSPAAIVLYFGLPLAFQALVAIPGMDGPARWLNGAQSLDPMVDHVMSATEWARAGTTLAMWVLLPLAIGAWRIARSEAR